MSVHIPSLAMSLFTGYNVVLEYKSLIVIISAINSVSSQPVLLSK